MNVTIRTAEPEDIKRIQQIRRLVKENILSNPERVTDEDCHAFLTQRGRGWVALSHGEIIGFAIADLWEDNIWALFLHPDYQDMGVGKKLHDRMLDWYFRQGKAKVWLSTGPNTRAEGFYRKQGWAETGSLANGELKFEMTSHTWKEIQQNH